MQLASSPEDDALLAETRAYKTLNQLKICTVAQENTATRPKAQKAHCERSLRFRHNDDEQRSDLSASFPLDIGVALEKLLQQRADSFGVDAETVSTQAQQAMADALCDLLFGEAGSSCEIPGEPRTIGHDRPMVVPMWKVMRLALNLQRLACDATSRTVSLTNTAFPINLGRSLGCSHRRNHGSLPNEIEGAGFPVVEALGGFTIITYWNGMSMKGPPITTTGLQSAAPSSLCA